MNFKKTAYKYLLIFLVGILIVYIVSINSDNSINNDVVETNEVSGKTDDTYIGQITEVNGNVWKTDKGISTQLQNGEKITKGSAIRTTADSMVLITINNSAKINLDGDSILSIREIAENNIELDLQRGSLIATLEDYPNQLTIKANEVRVSGNKVIFSVEKDAEVAVSVLKGQVNVKAGRSDTLVKENQDWKESRPFAYAIDGNKLVNSNDFYRWSLNEVDLPEPPPIAENKVEEKHEEEFQADLTQSPIGGIDVGNSSVSLSGTKASPNSVNLSWNASGDTSEGFLVNYGKGQSSYSAYVSNPSSRGFTVGQLEPGGSYYFNVCVVRSGSCISSSNSISVGM